MAKKSVPLSPAEYVSFIMGGPTRLAEDLELDQSTVSRWKNRRDSLGNVGQIPDFYHRRILAIAQKRKLPVSTHELVYGSVVNF